MPTSAAQSPALDRLQGLVERVTYHSPKSGFCVLRVNVRGWRELATVVGTLPEVRAGEFIAAEGKWVVDREHGQQLKAQTLKTTRPDSTEGIRKYLASGLIKGIGPTFAGRLVEAFSDQVFEVIENEPERLQTLEGIGPKRQARITNAWAEQRAIREIMVFLHQHGLSSSRAFRIYKTYGDGAIEQVNADPYRLARDIRGIGFTTADQLAAKLGISQQAPERVRAGVEHVLQELGDDGHCGYGRDGLVQKAAQLLEVETKHTEAAVDQLVEEERLVEHASAAQSTLVYLAGLDGAERQLAQNLHGLQREAHPCPVIDIEKAIEWVQGRIGFTLGDQQREALRMAATSKVSVLTGGPGVGKTTVVDAIVRVLAAKGLQIVQAAPTGRAARRMSEATGRDAHTIHRLLAFDPSSGGFKHDADNPLERDLFIIDETSMLDLPLAHQLVRAIPGHAAVLLVGDVDQLPSVGAGCVLRDIIESRAVSVCRLDQVFRQAAESQIVQNAHRVNQGQFPQLKQRAPDGTEPGDFYFVEAEDPERAVGTIERLVAEAIPRRFGFDPVTEIQVLTPMQRGTLGARHLNKQLQQRLNSDGPAVERYGWTFRVGDKVMQTANNYEKQTFNGDLGRIDQLDEVEQQLTVAFDDRSVVYDLGELDELVPAYATTIHKSQGSEYPAVVLPLHTQHYPLLQRSLLYTGLTRSRRLVVLVGTKKAIGLAVKSRPAQRRVTLLRERLGLE